MASARDSWERLSSAFEEQDVSSLLELYTDESIYLEPHNPPHEGAKLIQAYLNSWLQARDSIDIATHRMLSSDDGLVLAVEWTISYSAGGRRWNNLPRSSWIEVDDEGIRYHRDYF